MEIDDLKNLWQEENESLKSRIQLNEKAIKNMNLDGAVNTFRFFLNVSLAGRNLALVYFIISIVVAFNVKEEYYYSVPIIVGGLLMLWSFYHHLAIEKYKKHYNLSIVELQKSIENFRIHSMKSKHYDFLVVLVWLLTLSPVYLRYKYNFDIYSNHDNLLNMVIILVGGLFILYLVIQWGYNMYDKKLSKSETRLLEIMEFEKE
ncbi:MAG: hypothetical protein OCD76_02900 [Reichenbachiella sp.]